MNSFLPYTFQAYEIEDLGFKLIGEHEPMDKDNGFPQLTFCFNDKKYGDLILEYTRSYCSINGNLPTNQFRFSHNHLFHREVIFSLFEINSVEELKSILVRTWEYRHAIDESKSLAEQNLQA